MEHIKKTINQESYISRLVGLFPYYENFFAEDSNDPFKYIKPITNCWGQVIPNLVVGGNIDVTLYDIGQETISDEEGITNDVHSYRTIMDYYYKYYQNSGIVMSDRYHWFNDDIIDKNKTFAQWVELGIGRFLTPINTEISDQYYEWVYLGLLDAYKEEINTDYINVYDNYVYRQERLCAFNNGETDKFGFTYFVLTPEVMNKYEFGDKSYLYIDDDSTNGKKLSILLTYQSGDIIINNTTNNTLTYNCHIRERKTFEGENSVDTTLTIPPGTHIFHLQTIGDSDENNNFNERFSLISVERVELDPSNFDIKEVDKGLCCRYNKFIAKGGWFYWQLFNSVKLFGFIERIKQMFYNAARDDKMNGVSPNTLDLNIELLFNDSSLDLGVLTPLIREWDEMEVYYSGDIVIFTNGENDTPKCYMCKSENATFGKNKSPLDTSLWKLLTHTASAWENGDVYEVTGRTYSKLQSLRRVKDCFNEYSEKVTPSFPQDWLCYYRLGACNINHQDVNDQTYYYGDYIESIINHPESRTFEIIYWIDALLDKSGEKYTLNTTQNNGMFNGVKYIDTYRYEQDSDIEKLLLGTYKIGDTTIDLNKYLNGEYDIYKSYETNNEVSKYFYDNFVKFEFSGEDWTRSVVITDGYGGNTLRQYIECEYIKKSFYNGLDDLDYSYVVHHPYDLRMSAKPIINSEIIVDRGNTQAFEKHIRLSEVKTLEDMTNFNNGSFFNQITI